ncbi:MAG: UDP-glucose 4-epimerase GalE, partial [Bacteroidota bacterium]
AIPVEMGPRRAGDPAVLVASSEKIRRELGWKPTMGELRDIVQSAWTWMRNHQDGLSGDVSNVP